MMNETEGPPFCITIVDGDGIVVDQFWTDASYKDLVALITEVFSTYDTQEECELAQKVSDED